jgi:hypothetical protein
MGEMILSRDFTRGLILLTALAATPAAAAPVNYNFSATVANSCTIAGKAATVPFGALTSGTTAQAADDAAFCNQGQTTALIQRTNFRTGNTATTGFTNTIPMGASLTTTQGATLSDASAQPSGSNSSTGTSGTIGAFTGLTVTATLGSIGSNQLVAGTYSGTITVTLTPAS